MTELSNIEAGKEDVLETNEEESENEVEAIKEEIPKNEKDKSSVEESARQTTIEEETSKQEHELWLHHDDDGSKVVLNRNQGEQEDVTTINKNVDNMQARENDTKRWQGRDEKGASNQPGWGWNSWKGWGSSVITNAASQVSQFTNQVGDGLMQVLEPVEKDEDLDTDNLNKEPIEVQNSQPIKDTELTKDSKMIVDDDVTKETVALGTVIESNKSPWWISGLSNVVNKTTSAFQHTTKTVVHGGLDVLEVVGKKTYTMITEGDHGLKSVIKKNKERKKLPNLSHVLTEAKEISEMRLLQEESQLEEMKYLYSYWFDEYQGLLQLEAFELLCMENEIRTRQEYEKLEGRSLVVAKEALSDLNDVYRPATCEEEEEEEEDEDDSEDFGQSLMEYAAKLPVILNVQKLLQCQEETTKVLGDFEAGKVDKLVAKELHKEGVRCLAQLTALSIQHYHKLAQLLLRSPSSSSSPPQSSSAPPPESSSSPPESPSSSTSSSPFAHVSPIETAVIIVDFSKILRREMTIESNKFVSVLAALESTKERAAAAKNSKKSVDGDDGADDKNVDNDDGGKDDDGRNDDGDDDDYNEKITSIYLEAANSAKFVVKSLKLLLPAIQIALLNEAVGGVGGD